MNEENHRQSKREWAAYGFASLKEQERVRVKKSVTSVRLAMTFAGCFLGAGYISGREIWRFFGMFGIWG